MTTESTTPHICSADNWNDNPVDSAPRAVRWATRVAISLFGQPDWSKWHYTEGNGKFTACGDVVRLFLVDGSPEEGDMVKINCKRCLLKMQRHKQVDDQSKT